MEQNKHIDSLLKKYVNNRLAPEEAIELKTLMQHVEEETLDQHLSQLWDSYHTPRQAPRSTRKKISHNLRKVLLPGVRSRYSLTLPSIAAAICICLLAGFTAYLYVDRVQIQKTLGSEYSVQVGKGERATVLLPDGTKVHLNAESSLSYAASFGQQERRIQFSGEGYFDVATNEKKPFIVDNPAGSVKVLGTTFNFYATCQDDWFETTLIEGRVEVTLNMAVPQTATLSPNQKIRYNKRTGEWNIISTDLWEETAWRRGDIIFRSQTFGEVIGHLETYYGVTIHTEGNYPTELFTGTFHESDINAVLLNLQQHYNFAYSKTGNEINIKLNY